ncbi:MAG: amidohydrolase family protein, partial [Atribacterota bacterium]
MDLEERIAVAHGERKVDLLLKNARIVDVFSGNIYRGNIAIHQDLIVGIGDYDAENTMDLYGQLVAPGFFDAHVHIESSMITIPEYAKTVMPLGTTSVIIDPHEIANVLGLEGIRYMINSAACSPLGVYIMLSSCVPATRKETSGATISARDLTLFINHPWVLGLAEMMDYPGVIHRDIEVMLKILLTLEKKKKIDGHAPGLTGKDLSAYIASGIDSDHECTTREEALEKLRLGMAIIIREGTAAKNLDTLLPLTDPKNIHRFLFCTDDRHLYDLLNEGHINSMVKRAIKSGIDPVLAMRMATLNPALHYEIPNVGAIAPGYHADLIVFDDFKNMDISQVLKNGQSIYKNGELTTSWELDSDISVRSTM